MPTPRERMIALLTQYNALTASRVKVKGDLYLQRSSFSEPHDGITASYFFSASAFQKTVFTFQVTREVARYSLFVAPASSNIDALRLLYQDLQELIIQPLLLDEWALRVQQKTLLLENNHGETVPVLNGRRLWSNTLMLPRSTHAVWYNRRPIIEYTPILAPSDELIISTLSTAVSGAPTVMNQDGNFNPDASFSAEEVL